MRPKFPDAWATWLSHASKGDIIEVLRLISEECKRRTEAEEEARLFQSRTYQPEEADE
jgi:hypothetical protein